MNINDDDLGIIYLMNKKKEYMQVLDKTTYEEYYSLGKDVFLVCQADKNDTSFRIINTGFIKKCDEPFGEIRINPSTTEIFFISHYLGKYNIRFKAKYDNIEKNWDVRYKTQNGYVLSNLNNSLNNLEYNSNGLAEKNSFINIINNCKEVFFKSLNEKKKIK